MTSTIMRNGIDFLMKELNKSVNNHHSRHHINDHNHRDNNSNKKDSVTMIWTLQAVKVHIVVKIDLHKVGRKIIS
jgi:hypothetical protein